jgi:uncharacterized protein YmfQ (DUF2313 family)
MPIIVLTEEQATVIASAREPVQVCDPAGKVLATIKPAFTAEELAEARRRVASPGPWYTSQQVQARLKALQEEWDRTGGFDEAHLREFLARLDAADPGHMRPKGLMG